IVHHHRIHVARDQRLHGDGEGVVGHQPILADQINRDEVVGGAGLYTDDQFLIGGQFLSIGEAVFIRAGEDDLFEGDVTIGEVHHLSTVGLDGDTVSGHVILAVGDSQNHAIPGGFDIFGNAVEAAAD